MFAPHVVGQNSDLKKLAEEAAIDQAIQTSVECSCMHRVIKRGTGKASGTEVPERLGDVAAVSAQLAESPEGAAQAALAKLGDKVALEELREELEGTRVRSKRQVIWKLGFAATPETAAMLISFILTDKCKHCLNLGDTGEDPAVWVHEMLTRMLPNPPIERSTFTESDVAVWQTWWQSNKGRLTMVEPHRSHCRSGDGLWSPGPFASPCG